MLKGKKKITPLGHWQQMAVYVAVGFDIKDVF